MLLCDGQLYQENYSIGTVSRTRGLVNRCPEQNYESYGTSVAITLYDYNFLFLNLTQGLNLLPKLASNPWSSCWYHRREPPHPFIFDFFLYSPGQSSDILALLYRYMSL